jgi:hypothetical protein
MQRTLNRELKELEVVGREAIATCRERLPGKGLFYFWGNSRGWWGKPHWHDLAIARESSRYQFGGYYAPPEV